MINGVTMETMGKQCDCCKRTFRMDVMFCTGDFCICPACNAIMVLEFTRNPTKFAAVRSYVKAAHLGENMVIQTVGVYPWGTKDISKEDHNDT